MRLERRNIWRIAAAGFILFLLIYYYMFSGEIILTAAKPIILGGCIAYPMNIMINWFDRFDPLYRKKILKSEKIHRGLCVAFAVVVLTLCLAFILGYLAPQLTACIITLLDKVPGGVRYLLEQPFVVTLIPDDTLATLQEIDWTKWINHLVTLVNSDDLVNGMTATATSALSVTSTLLFGLLFACYFLSGKEKTLDVARRMVRAFVPEGHREGVFRSGAMLNDCFHDFIVCQAAQALIIGVSASVLMWIFGFPYASMIGALNGFCALIPVIGGYIGAIFGTLMILADAPGMALFFLIFIIVLQNAIGTLIFPRLIGRSLGLPAVWTLAAVLIGSGLRGITGMLLGVPLTAFAYRMIGEELRKREAEMATAEAT